jgi:hypothetical protein
MPFGESWERWITAWWLWCLSDPFGASPAEDITGEFCCKNQCDPNVWFLAGTFGGKAERTCTISVGKAIFFPIVNDLISYAEYNHLDNEAELRAYAKDDLDTTTCYEVSLNGIKLQNLQKYRIQSDLFNIVLSSKSDTGITSNSTMAISDGYWIFLQPLSLGQHILSFKGEKKLYDTTPSSGYEGENGMFKVEVKYHITIM